MSDAHDDLVMIWNMVKVMMMMFLLSYVPFEYRIWWWLEKPSLTLVWTFFYFSECSQSLLWQMIKTSKKVSRSETKLTTWERSDAFLTSRERSEMLFVTFAELSAAHAIDMCRTQQNGQSQLVEKTLLEKILKENVNGNWNSWNLQGVKSITSTEYISIKRLDPKGHSGLRASLGRRLLCWEEQPKR